MAHDTRASSRETRVLPGDLGASGGAAPLGGDMAAAGAEGGSEESARESEAWAAAVPPVRAPHSLFTFSSFFFFGYSFCVPTGCEIPI